MKKITLTILALITCFAFSIALAPPSQANKRVANNTSVYVQYINPKFVRISVQTYLTSTSRCKVAGVSRKMRASGPTYLRRCDKRLSRAEIKRVLRALKRGKIRVTLYSGKRRASAYVRVERV